MISLADFPRLSDVAWNLKADAKLTRAEALELYERHWHHIKDIPMPAHEQTLLKDLVAKEGKGIFAF